jgi:hypothetical protein
MRAFWLFTLPQGFSLYRGVFKGKKNLEKRRGYKRLATMGKQSRNGDRSLIRPVLLKRGTFANKSSLLKIQFFSPTPAFFNEIISISH